MQKLLLAAVLLTASQAWAQVYKCVDASGKTVYLQQPCPAGQSSKVISRTPPPAADAPAKPGAKPPANPDAEFRKRQLERAEADKKASEQSAQAKQMQEQCQKAREQVAQYEMGGRFSGINAQGERYYYDENQIAQAKARAQASVAESCK